MEPDARGGVSCREDNAQRKRPGGTALRLALGVGEGFDLASGLEAGDGLCVCAMDTSDELLDERQGPPGAGTTCDHEEAVAAVVFLRVDASVGTVHEHGHRDAGLLHGVIVQPRGESASATDVEGEAGLLVHRRRRQRADGEGV